MIAESTEDAIFDMIVREGLLEQLVIVKTSVCDLIVLILHKDYNFAITISYVSP